MSKPSLTMIAARARNGVIGHQNRMPWHLPEDLKHFRQQTMGHVVLLGRKTWESIGRPLPGRRMVVISRQSLTLPEGVELAASLDEAIAHINEYGSHHTDSIITQNHAHGMRFLREVDSASVMINASTRFADGFEYGLGAEIGISTDKLHARGPVGLEGLTSQKYVVFGHGEIRT